MQKLPVVTQDDVMNAILEGIQAYIEEEELISPTGEVNTDELFAYLAFIPDHGLINLGEVRKLVQKRLDDKGCSDECPDFASKACPGITSLQILFDCGVRGLKQSGARVVQDV